MVADPKQRDSPAGREIQSSEVEVGKPNLRPYDHGIWFICPAEFEKLNAPFHIIIDTFFFSGKYVIAVIDADNVIIESNEANNQAVFGSVI